VRVRNSPPKRVSAPRGCETRFRSGSDPVSVDLNKPEHAAHRRGRLRFDEEWNDVLQRYASPLVDSPNPCLGRRIKSRCGITTGSKAKSRIQISWWYHRPHWAPRPQREKNLLALAGRGKSFPKPDIWLRRPIVRDARLKPVLVPVCVTLYASTPRWLVGTFRWDAIDKPFDLGEATSTGVCLPVSDPFSQYLRRERVLIAPPLRWRSTMKDRDAGTVMLNPTRMCVVVGNPGETDCRRPIAHLGGSCRCRVGYRERAGGGWASVRKCLWRRVRR